MVTLIWPGTVGLCALRFDGLWPTNLRYILDKAIQIKLPDEPDFGTTGNVVVLNWPLSYATREPLKMCQQHSWRRIADKNKRTGSPATERSKERWSWVLAKSVGHLAANTPNVKDIPQYHVGNAKLTCIFIKIIIAF